MADDTITQPYDPALDFTCIDDFQELEDVASNAYSRIAILESDIINKRAQLNNQRELLATTEAAIVMLGRTVSWKRPRCMRCVVKCQSGCPDDDWVGAPAVL